MAHNTLQGGAAPGEPLSCGICNWKGNWPVSVPDTQMMLFVYTQKGADKRPDVFDVSADVVLTGAVCTLAN